jgi:hypothetical protein
MPIILNFSSTTGKMGVWYQKQTKSKLNTHRQDYFYLVFGFWFVFVCLFWSAFLFFLVAKSKKIVWRLLLNLIIFKSKGNGFYYLLSEKKEG